MIISRYIENDDLILILDKGYNFDLV